MCSLALDLGAGRAEKVVLSLLTAGPLGFA
jgi:hypothetical protein